MARKVIRVAIAGQGRSGYDIHARWLREVPRQYRIVVVSDTMADRRAQARQEFGCRAMASWEKMIEDGDYDLLVNALPSTLHPKATIAALRKGLNVVCEKPLAVKVKDFDRMTAAARASRRLLAPFQNVRFAPFFGKIQDVVASGLLGRLMHVRISYSAFKRRWDWQTGRDQWGGGLNNTAPHPLDHALVLFGPGKPKVFCRLASGPNCTGDADDLSLVVLHGKQAPTIEVLVSNYQCWPGDPYVISGTLGGLTGGPAGLKWRYYDPKKAPKLARQRGWSVNREFCAEKLPWVKRSWKPPTGGLAEFQIMSKAFYNNVHDVLVNKGKLVVTPAQVRRQIAVLEQCHRQNRLG